MLVSGFEVPPPSNIGEQVGRESREFPSDIMVLCEAVNFVMFVQFEPWEPFSYEKE
jgi:hypothetical protein